jgi:hypothetical protein
MFECSNKNKSSRANESFPRHRPIVINRLEVSFFNQGRRKDEKK